MIRHEEIRFKVLRNGADYAWIFPKENSKPSLRFRPDGEIKMSLQGTFLPYALDAGGREMPVDWLADEIQAMLYLNGTPHSLGVVSAATIEEDETNTGLYLNMEGYDRCWRVRETKTESILHLSAGTNYLTPVTNLLTACGITTVFKTPTSTTLTEDREDWDVGTSNLTIINDLLKEINYKPLWFDSGGAAVLEPKITPTVANVRHVLSTRKKNFRDPRAVDIISIDRRVLSSMDYYNAPNVFVVYCANPDKSGVMIATAENMNPLSPISIPRRGRRIVEVEEVKNIASQQELKKYVEQKRDKSLMTKEILTVSTLLYPGFGMEDVVGLQLGEEGAPKFLDAICTETSWDMPLGVGELMKHKLERVVYNLD